MLKVIIAQQEPIPAKYLFAMAAEIKEMKNNKEKRGICDETNVSYQR